MSKALQRCQVCEHPSVFGINNAILNGKSYRALARDFKIGSEASGKFVPDHKKVIRHAENCMATSFQKVQDDNLTAQGAAIQNRLQQLDEHVDTAIQDALEGEPVMLGDTPMLKDDGSPMMIRRTAHLRVLLAAVREGRHNAELKAKLAGAMPEEDGSAADAARKGLEDPEVRKLMQQMEERMALLEAQAGRDKLDAT